MTLGFATQLGCFMYPRIRYHQLAKAALVRTRSKYNEGISISINICISQFNRHLEVLMLHKFLINILPYGAALNIILPIYFGNPADAVSRLASSLPLGLSLSLEYSSVHVLSISHLFPSNRSAHYYFIILWQPLLSRCH